MKLPIPGPQISPPRPSGHPNFPHQSIQSALETEIPADRIARKINEMIEATRETSAGSVESDWTTVEAGLRLYLEFTKRPISPGYTVVETTSGFPAVPSSAEWQGKPHRQKQPLPRQNEDADALKNFMTYSQAPAFANQASVLENEGTEFSIQGWQRRPATPDPVAPSGPAPVNRSAPWLSMLSALTIGGLVLGVAFLSPQPDSGPGEHHTPLQIAGTSEDLSPETTAPAATGNASVPSDATPAGWGNRKQYDEWTPKFEASLHDE